MPPILQHPPPRPPPAAQEEDLSEEDGLDQAFSVGEEPVTLICIQPCLSVGRNRGPRPVIAVGV